MLVKTKTDHRPRYEALSRTQAIICFTPDGTIEDANDRFCEAMGYNRSEIIGRHHSLFVDQAYAGGEDYRAFWADLKAGRFRSDEFERLGKGGKRVTLQATYSPIETHGRVTGVIKIATVVESRKAQQERIARLLETLDKLPVPIMTCDPDTFVIDYANEASIRMLGKIQQYINVRADEIIGSKIDVFHKVPEHQHRMLNAMGSDGHQTTIKVGPEYLELKINRIAGRPLLVWYVVTHRVAMAKGMEDTVAEMTRVGDAVTSQAAELSGYVRETMNLTGTVANAVSEQATAIHEVAMRTTDVAREAEAVETASIGTKHQLEGLTGAVGSISDVVSTVSSIAEQTKLLALNATIEAARAGAAGAGFAVVASEVKALSEQTARATSEIGKRIEAIQAETHKTVDTVSGVINGIGQISQLVNSVASATQEQRAVAQSVSETMGRVAEYAENTGKSAERVAGISDTVRATAQELSSRLAEFVKKE